LLLNFGSVSLFIRHFLLLGFWHQSSRLLILDWLQLSIIHINDLNLFIRLLLFFQWLTPVRLLFGFLCLRIIDILLWLLLNFLFDFFINLFLSSTWFKCLVIFFTQFVLFGLVEQVDFSLVLCDFEKFCKLRLLCVFFNSFLVEDINMSSNLVLRIWLLKILWNVYFYPHAVVLGNFELDSVASALLLILNIETSKLLLKWLPQEFFIVQEYVLRWTLVEVDHTHYEYKEHASWEYGNCNCLTKFGVIFLKSFKIDQCQNW